MSALPVRYTRNVFPFRRISQASFRNGIIGEEEQQVYEEMSSEHPDVARVTEIAKNKNCRYIVFNTSFHQIPEDLTEYGYEKIAVIEDVYAVYSRIGS